MEVNEVKKFILFFGSIFISLLLISTASAVPKVNSDHLMNKIQEFEEMEKMIFDKLDLIKTHVESGGLIDLLIQLINWLIGIIQQIINLIQKIFGLVSLIENLVNLIVKLFEAIIQLINFIIDIFTPNVTY